MTENEPATVSTLALKAICLIGFINATQMLHLVFSPMTAPTGAFYPTYFASSVALSLVCLLGLWQQKKWAALAYAVLLICNQLILLTMGYWQITALIIPVSILGLLYKNRTLLT